MVVVAGHLEFARSSNCEKIAYGRAGSEIGLHPTAWPVKARRVGYTRLFTLVFFAGLSFGQAQTNKWEVEILALEANDRTNPPPKAPVVFVGSSSIRLWKTLAQDFPKHHVLNRGFGGSEISDSVQYADRIVIPYRPRLVVMYAGGNDIHNGKTPETVFHDFQAFVAKVHAAAPSARIAYISIAPNPARWSEVEKV